MATFPVQVEVDFLDSAERTATVTYQLRERYDDAANAGQGNWEDVRGFAGNLVTALENLTWDQIPSFRIKMAETTGSLSANVAANNQIRAFTRVTLANGEQSYFEVPAWDDLTFDQDNNNLLSAAYNTAAQAVADLIEDPDSTSDMTTVNWSQSRTRKSRNVLS